MSVARILHQPLLAFAFVSSLVVATAAACSQSSMVSFDEAETFPAGRATTSFVPFASLELPASNLSPEVRPAFFAGKALAEQPWVKAPTVTDARDGLGPLYNARTCLDCHRRGGKGEVPQEPQRPLSGGLVRLSIPGADARLGAVPEPTYGLQLQTQSTALSHQLRTSVTASVVPSVPPEAIVHLSWQQERFRFPDGHVIGLRRPELRLTQLGYGPLHPQTVMSLRIAPAIAGAGLIELIADEAIARLQDPDDADEDGVSGRQNVVWDVRSERRVPGRFGHKANRATLETTVAGAFAEDMGISSSLFPSQPCTAAQRSCQEQTHGAPPGQAEIDDELLALVVDFNRGLGVPKRRDAQGREVLAGKQLFYEVGCASCHHPRFVTEPSATHPHLGAQTIWPYSDFLLHDMGPALSDERPDYDASGQEWRTPPLWGIGLSGAVTGSEGYLHDGRARSLEEAIVWHGGEAEPARERFVHLIKRQRQQLLAFVRSL